MKALTTLPTETKIATITETKAVQFIPLGESVPIRLTLQDVLDVVANPTKSGKLPTERDCLVFMELCKARQLNPFVGDAYLVGYDSQGGPEFSLITAIQALLKRAELSEHYEGIESGLILENKDGVISETKGAFHTKIHNIIGGWARVFRDDRKIPHEARVLLSVYNTGRSRWAKDPGGMIVKVAKAAVLREAFPTEAGGLYLTEEFEARERAVNGTVVEEERVVGGKTVAALPDAKDELYERLLAREIEKEKREKAVFTATQQLVKEHQAKEEALKPAADDTQAEPKPEPEAKETEVCSMNLLGDLEANLFDVNDGGPEIKKSEFLAFVNDTKGTSYDTFLRVPAQWVRDINENFGASVKQFRKWQERKKK